MTADPLLLACTNCFFPERTLERRGGQIVCTRCGAVQPAVTDPSPTLYETTTAMIERAEASIAKREHKP